MELKLAGMVQMATRFFPELQSDEQGLHSRMERLALAAYKRTDLLFNAQDALHWADGYTVPTETVRNDERLFASHGRNFEQMVSRRFKALAPNRLSRSRIDRWTRGDNPERSKLYELAEVGMTVHTSKVFQPNSLAPRIALPKLGTLYRSASNAVNRMEMESQHTPGLAFVLREATALEILGAHFSPFGWAPKDGKVFGRPTTNASAAGKGNPPLNSKAAKEACDRQWGEIMHPTISDIANMVLESLEEQQRIDLSFDPTTVRLWKMDLKGAYNLINFRVEDVRLMANPMTDGLVIFHLCGQFGWTGTPSAFQVVTRAIRFELGYRLPGRCLMYVDDIIGVCLEKNLQFSLATTKAVVEGLLGPGSIADNKTEFGRRLTAIGYDIDLDSMLVAIAVKNVHKAVHGFLTVDTDKKVPVRVLEKLASWASRYGGICTEMLPVTKQLYFEYSGLDHNKAKLLTREGQRAVRVLRLLIMLTALDESRFARPLRCFRPGCAKFIIEFDGSLTGAGIIWYRVADDGTEVLLGGAAISLKVCQLLTASVKHNSRNQNTAEFITLTLGIRGLYLLGELDQQEQNSVHLRGDSESALTWARTGRFRSLICYNAATIFILQNQLLKVVVSSVENIFNGGNKAADYLSRNEGREEHLAQFLKNRKYEGMSKVPLFEQALLELASPAFKPESEEEFEGWWAGIRTAVMAKL